jgi:hypothetical protein
MSGATFGSAAFAEALKTSAFKAVFNPPPARHTTKEEYVDALHYALAMGWRSPMANHAGRWFTFKNDPDMCRYTSPGKGHRCKDMKPDPRPTKRKRKDQPR